jgi:HEAT repeat protein
MSDDRPSLDGAKALSTQLSEVAERRDEDRFTTLVEAVLHEPDDAAVGLLAPFVAAPGAIGRVAAHGLLMLGQPSLDALLGLLEAPELHTRVNAAWALGSLRDKRAADGLMDAVEDPTSPPALVEASLASLAEQSDTRMVPRLRSLLMSPDYGPYRARIAMALGHIGDKSAVPDLVPLLHSQRSEERLRGAEALVRLMDKRGWPVIFEILKGVDHEGDSLVASLRDLGDLSSSLGTFLGDDQYHLRQDAAEMLGTFGDRQAVPHLIDALRDINAQVRGAAAYALGRLADRRATRPLVNALEDSSGWVRLCALRALGLVGDPKALKAAEKFLFDPDPEIALAAQEALGYMRDA